MKKAIETHEKSLVSVEHITDISIRTDGNYVHKIGEKTYNASISCSLSIGTDKSRFVGLGLYDKIENAFSALYLLKSWLFSPNRQDELLFIMPDEEYLNERGNNQIHHAQGDNGWLSQDLSVLSHTN